MRIRRANAIRGLWMRRWLRVREMNVQPKVMVSRAYHDSLFMSRICPTGMIFIPCRKGVSHRPDEFAKPEDIGRGVEVLARTMAAPAK